MGIANIGIPSLVLILVVALIIFGPSKLPEIGKAAGQTIREFKKSTNDLMNDDVTEETKETEKTSKDVDNK